MKLIRMIHHITISITQSVSSFVDNIAKSGKGGALYLDSSVTYMAIGGFQPVLVKCTLTSCGLAGEQRGRLNSTVTQRMGGFYIAFDPLTTYGNCTFLDGVRIASSTGGRFSGGSYQSKPNTCKNSDPTSYPGVNGAQPVYLSGTSISYAFKQTSATGYIQFYVFPVPPSSASSPSVLFSGNRAGLSGGAIYSGSSNANVFIMKGAVFSGNQASSGSATTGSSTSQTQGQWSGTGSGGGAIWIDSGNSNIFVFTSTFNNNSANSGNGGAIAVARTNTPVGFFNCSYTKNRASNGGAAYVGVVNGNGVSGLVTNLAIQFRNSWFLHNSAGSDGGGLYISSLNAVLLDTVVFIDNQVSTGHGGAIYLDSKNFLKMTTATLSNNRVFTGHGGGIYSNVQNGLTSLGSLTMVNNSAMLSAGALYLSTGSTFTSSGTSTAVLQGNMCKAAGCYGGAVASMASSVTTWSAAGTYFGKYIRKFLLNNH
jgi:predicted outer membrane repeat protein